MQTLQQGGEVDVTLVWLLVISEVVALTCLALLLLLVVESRAPSGTNRRD